MAADDQSSLITALKQRDRSAWSVAVDRHLHEVYGFVFHLVGGDRTVAEDLNQETWLEAMDAIDHCDATRGNFRNWLFGIARKRVALHYRRRTLAGNPAPLGDQFEESAELEDISVLPEDVLEQVERTSVVRAAILVLPDDRRKALLWEVCGRAFRRCNCRPDGQNGQGGRVAAFPSKGADAASAPRVRDALWRPPTGKQGVVP